MNNFTIGSYVPGNSYIYKLDPRLKIISTVILMIGIFFVKNIWVLLGILGLILLIFISARLSIFKALMGLRHLIVLSLFIFVFQVLFNKTGEIVYSEELSFSVLTTAICVLLLIIYIFTSRYFKVKSIYLILMIALGYLSLVFIPAYPNNYFVYTLNIYESGLHNALFVLIRLIIVMFIATILTISTKPNDLTLGLEWLFRPLKIFKINSEEIALIITIALRYIPTIVDEANKIMDAQASRGADFKEGNIGRKIGQVVSLLVPMFVISFERSDELADAMLSRNFVPGKPKTRYHVLKFGLLDLFAFIFVLLIIGGIVCTRILL